MDHELLDRKANEPITTADIARFVAAAFIAGAAIALASYPIYAPFLSTQ